VIFQPPNPVFPVCDIVFQALDVVTVKPLVLRLIDGDLAHELTQVVQPSLDAPEALIALVEPLVGLVEPFVRLVEPFVRLVEPLIEVHTQRADTIADLA
jgi:hypothetical protein